MGNSIQSVLNETRLIPPPVEFSDRAHINKFETFLELSKEAREDPEAYWGRMANEHLDWFRPWNKVLDWEPPFAQWFQGGQINVSHNCLDRHLTSARKNKAAIIWEGEPGDSQILTYQTLHREVCKFSNVLKSLGVKKGDRVAIYMPMIPEVAIAMLACTRIGAPHSVVFGGFSSEALRDRINDAQASVVITADGGYRRGQVLELKNRVDEALNQAPSVSHVISVKRTNSPVQMIPGRDHWWHELMENASTDCPAEPLDSEHMLFILYTSGTTGKPKGVVHSTAGYLLGATLSSKWVFDLKEEDTYWCTADAGWITGHSYIIYGPLSNGATTMMYEGAPNYPNPDRFWELIDKYQVNIFYTAPTAIRAFIKWGEQWPLKHKLNSLRLLGTVGEPINPEAWMWYYKIIGKEKCPIVDTWWQTETGSIMLTPLPGVTPMRPGSATFPLPGVQVEVVDSDGNSVQENEGGYLIIKQPWPSMIRNVYGDPERFKEQYWSKYPNLYFTGDGARFDEDGNFWIMGRVDDVINVSGHRLGTMEVESALVSHPKVAEAAVVDRPDEIKGQAICAFVTLEGESQSSESLKEELKAHVVQEIGSIAKPDDIHFSEALPKTRSGKIMRRLLRSIASGEQDIGDTSTLEDASILDKLRQEV